MSQLETKIIEPEPFTSPAIQEPLISSRIAGFKGPVEAFVPLFGNDKLKNEIAETGIIPAGFFQSCTLFDENASKAQEQARLRREIPLAQNIVEIYGTIGEFEDPRDVMSYKLLRLKVEATYSQAAMVEAARQYFQKQKEGTLTKADVTFLTDRINTAQDKIYPQLDETIARQALDKIQGKNETVEQPLMSAEVRKAWYGFLHAKFDDTFELVYDNYPAEDEPIIGERLRDMTEAFMRATGLPMTEDKDNNDAWKCVYDDSSSGFRVESAAKRVVCGKRDKPLDRMEFEKLMMHEVIVHVWRAENGSRTGYSAFQTGLPGYIEKEEGLGILMEYLWSGEDPDVLSRDHFRYASLSFADGIYDGVLHDEQETYDFTRELMNRAGIKDDDELYRHVMRPFRGMPPGCRMHSNASYLSGKIDMARLLTRKYYDGDSIEEVFNFLSAGKIDNENEVQASLLRSCSSSQVYSEGAG